MPADTQIDLTDLAPWSYHQTDEVRRTFELATHTRALDFIVSVIEIAEESGLKLGFWLKGSYASITLEICETGAPETLVETLREIERLAKDV